MNRTQQILIGVLVAQIVLAVVLLWPQPAKQPSAPLFGELTADQISSFTVSDTDGHEVTINRSGEGWVIDGTDDYPTMTDTVPEALESLVQITTGRTVATNKESHARLKVADADYTRKLVIRDDQGAEQILYIGTTVGTGATNVRLGGSDEVMLTDKVTGYDFGSEARNWIITKYVAIDRAQMTRLILENASGSYEFANTGTSDAENWVMSGLAAGETFNSNNMVSLLTRLTSLQLQEPLGKSEKPEYGLDDPLAVATLYYTGEDGAEQQLVLTIGAKDDAGNYYAKANVSDYYVKLPSTSVVDFVERTREAFLQAAATPTPGAE
jgi:hypothetical protein